jgi:hypothetical protein
MQMSETLKPMSNDPEFENAQKRIRKIKKFYKELASWAGISVFLVALNLFLSGNISWAKYPVFFWGIFLVVEYFQVIRLQRIDKEWEDRMMRKFTGRERLPPNTSDEPVQGTQEDYSQELLGSPPEKQKEMADLSDYRKVKKPWKDEDLV